MATMDYPAGTTDQVLQDSINNNVTIEQKPEVYYPQTVEKELMNNNDGESQKYPDLKLPVPPKNADLFYFKQNYGGSASDDGSPRHSSPNPSGSFEISNSFTLPLFPLSRDAHTPEPPKDLNLVKFITAGMANHLKTLGVEEFDCKEYVDTWLSHRRQKRWKQSLPNPIRQVMHSAQYSHSCFPPPDFLKLANQCKGFCSVLKADDVKGFSQSEPNSSMLRLSTKENEELGQFSVNMEEVRINLNNASCTLLQGMMVLMLPYLKLLTGNHLATLNHETFIEEWMQIVTRMAKELRPDSGKETKVMLTREYHAHLSESKQLYKQLSKLFKKVKALYKENERAHKKYLARLHPRSLTHRSRFDPHHVPDNKDGSSNTDTDTFAKKAFLAERVQFSPIPLYRANTTTVELFKDHIILSKSKTGNVVLKYGLGMEWEKFADLPFQRKRELLLSIFEDLHWTLNSTSSTTNRIKELFIDGYPESICGKIKDNLGYLKKMSLKEELLVLSKVTIANQVKSFLDSLARLMKILKDTTQISKSFYRCIKNSNPGSALKTEAYQTTNISEASCTDASQDLKLKLVVPFPMSTDPIQDQFFMTTL